MKYTPTSIYLSLTNSMVAGVNANLERISTALENTLSRDGTSPNHMNSDVDMNNNDILNAKSLGLQELSVKKIVYNGKEVGLVEFFDASKFATASPGAKADTALQPATGRMVFADLATAATATIPAGVISVTLQAYSTSAGPVGGANYREAFSDAEYNAFSPYIKFATANGRKFVADRLDNSSQVGIIADGVTDNYARLQAYADYCGYTGRPFVLADSQKHYCTSQKIVFKTMRQLDPVDTAPLSDIHFSDLLPFQIYGEGKAKVVATAAMTSVFELIFNTSFSNLGPFYSVVSGIHIDGNALATACIKSNYVMHTHYSHLRLQGATRGIDYTGYGGFRAYKCVIRCKYGFYLVGGGGDSVIKDCDFYAQEAASACIYLGYYGGNMVIEGNTFTNEQNFAASYCVQMDGTTASASEEIRDVVISDNEFCGFPSAIYARGKAAGNKNVWNIKISKNHVNPYGANSYGRLIDAADCTDFDIFDNALNGKRRVDASNDAVRLLRCERFHVHDNFGWNYMVAAFYDQDGVDNDWIGNVMDDVGKSGSGFTCMDIYGSAGTRRIERNTFRQSSASYAQNGIYERDGADFTIALNNEFSGMTNPQRKNATSTNSVMQRTVYGTAAPVSGSWNVGDKVVNKTPTAGGNFGWVCTTAGESGTWKTYGAIAA